VPTTVTHLGSALSLGVVVVALGLGLWQWVDHRRPATVSPTDERHFHNQDLRRWTVFGLMLTLSALMFVGIHLPAQVQKRPNLHFIQTWVAVLGVIVGLLGLAFLDWAATRRYARRKRQEIAREGMAIIRDEIRRRAALRNLARDGEPGADPPDADAVPSDN
jgi:hypothetical protein